MSEILPADEVRLISRYVLYEGSGEGWDQTDLCDSHEALRARCETLEAVLRELCRWHRPDGDCWCDAPEAHSPGCLVARAALEKKNG